MRALPLALGLIGALAAAGCADPAATPAPATGQEANVMVCAPGSFQNGNECIPARTDCPTGTALQDGSCVVVAETVEEPPPPADPPDAQVAAGPAPFDTVVDPRPGRHKPRARQLLVTELQALERLFQAAPKSSPDRPRIARRLAENYVELSAAAAQEAKLAANGVAAEKAKKIELASRTAAIKYYKLLIQDYPKFCLSASASSPVGGTGCSDEALYYVSLEYVRSGQRDDARKSMLQLIQNYPQSAFVPHTFFGFGEMFFQEALGDPSKWVLAEQSYKETAKYTSSPIAPWALLRLAEIYVKKGDQAQAQATLQKIARDYPGSAAAQSVPASP